MQIRSTNSIKNTKILQLFCDIRYTDSLNTIANTCFEKIKILVNNTAVTISGIVILIVEYK